MRNHVQGKVNERIQHNNPRKGADFFLLLLQISGHDETFRRNKQFVGGRKQISARGAGERGLAGLGSKRGE